MGRFTELDGAAVRAVAAGFGVGEVTSFTAIAAGTVNSNFRLDTTAGAYFLRVNEGKSEADVRYEAELLFALARAGVRATPPLCARDGQPFAIRDGRYLSLFPWLPGSPRQAGAITAGDAAAVGRALAELHVAGLELAPGFARDSRYAHREIVRRFETVAASPRAGRDPALARALGAIGDEIAWLEAREAIRRDATQGVIHGDLFPDNTLFAGPGAIAAVIDFEQASTGSLAYDLAVCLNAWCFDRDFEPARVAALVTGYRAVRDLPAADVRALAVEVRAAAMRFTVTRITDVYLPGLDTGAKDFRRFLARLRRWREVGAGGLQSWAKLGE